MVSNYSQYGWAHKVQFQNWMLFPYSKFPSSYWMLATLILEYFCIYNQETLKEFYSDWLIRNPWFMACLIPPDFHWVVAWRERGMCLDFVKAQELHIFCRRSDSSLYSKHLFSFYLFIYTHTHTHTHTHIRNTKVISMWVQRLVSFIGYCFHIFQGQEASTSHTARAQWVLMNHLLSCNARAYLGWSLCCCQSNEGQQLWWQISFDKLNDPKEEKSVALIATGE